MEMIFIRDYGLLVSFYPIFMSDTSPIALIRPLEQIPIAKFQSGNYDPYIL